MQPTAAPDVDWNAPYVDPYAARIAAAQERLAQPVAPTYTPEQQQQRIQANSAGYGLGLAAQLSGDDSLMKIGKGISDTADKEAAAKITDHGTMDPLSGKFTYNPEYLQETQRQELGKVQDKSDAGAAHWNDQRQHALEHQQDIQLQGQWRADAAAESRANRAQVAQGMKQNQIVAAEQHANGQFMQATQKFRLESSAAENILNVVGNSKPGKMDANTQQSLVLMLNHMTDAGSVVREGEFARTAQGQGFLNNARMQIQKLQNGQFLTNDTIQSIKNLAQQYKDLNTERIGGYAQNYADIAGRQGLNPLNVVGEYMPSGIKVVNGSEPAPAAPAGALPQATAAAAGRTRPGAPNGRGTPAPGAVVNVDF